MLKYGTKKSVPFHINSILVESCNAFKVSAGNIIREIFVKTNIHPIRTHQLTTNTQVFVDSVQVSSVPKAEEINNISCHTVAHIEVQETRTDNPMFVSQEKGSQKSSSKVAI